MNSGHGGYSFLPTNMFTKRVKLGIKRFFLTHNLSTITQVFLNMCDKPIFIQTLFAKGTYATQTS